EGSGRRGARAAGGAERAGRGRRRPPGRRGSAEEDRPGGGRQGRVEVRVCPGSTPPFVADYFPDRPADNRGGWFGTGPTPSPPDHFRTWYAPRHMPYGERVTPFWVDPRNAGGDARISTFTTPVCPGFNTPMWTAAIASVESVV